jgi:hypothetical protein
MYKVAKIELIKHDQALKELAKTNAFPERTMEAQARAKILDKLDQWFGGKKAVGEKPERRSAQKSAEMQLDEIERELKEQVGGPETPGLS